MLPLRGPFLIGFIYFAIQAQALEIAIKSNINLRSIRNKEAMNSEGYVLKAGTIISIPDQYVVRDVGTGEVDFNATTKKWMNSPQSGVGSYRFTDSQGTRRRDTFFPVRVVLPAPGSRIPKGAAGHIALGAFSRKNLVTQKSTALPKTKPALDRPQPSVEAKKEQTGCGTPQERSELLRQMRGLTVLLQCQSANLQICQDYNFLGNEDTMSKFSDLANKATLWDSEGFRKLADKLGTAAKQKETAAYTNIKNLQTLNQILSLTVANAVGKGGQLAIDAIDFGLDKIANVTQKRVYCDGEDSEIQAGPKRLPHIQSSAGTCEPDQSFDNPYLRELIFAREGTDHFVDGDESDSALLCQNLLDLKSAFESRVKDHFDNIMNTRFTSIPQCKNGRVASLDFNKGSQAHKASFYTEPGKPVVFDIQRIPQATQIVRITGDEYYPGLNPMGRGFFAKIEVFGTGVVPIQQEVIPKPSDNPNVIRRRLSHLSAHRAYASFDSAGHWRQSLDNLQNSSGGFEKAKTGTQMLDTIQYWLPRLEKCCGLKPEEQSACFNIRFAGKMELNSSSGGSADTPTIR